MLKQIKPISRLPLLALTVTALAAAGIQGLFEEHRLLNEATSRLGALAVGLNDESPGLLNRLQHMGPKLSAVATSICLFSGNTFKEFPPRGPGKSLCTYATDGAQQDSHAVRSWTVPHSRKRYLYYLEPVYASNDLLIIAQDISTIGSFWQMLWSESFLRTLLLWWLGGLLVLAMVATQIRRWIRETLAASLGSRRKDSEVISVNPIRKTLGDRRLVVIANREPYIHQKKDGAIEVLRPASGLVSALEPVLRQSGGLWIAHGSGNADLEMCDSQNEVAVPPGNPRYTLKRIWLKPDEEEGYYYGFANEGLWPLCHLAHNRPSFRLSDWNYYKKVNERFANETPNSVLNDGALILVQDYHLALLPELLRNRVAFKNREDRPKIGIFWHIPWPNPEAFGICPWSKELLSGMLGADVIGFHTQYHVNNFLETCDRYLEARIDWENFSVTMNSRESLVRAFPIGIDTVPVKLLEDDERTALKKKLGIHAEWVAVGVDRLDYTKGLVERVEAVGRFLEKYPEYVGRFSLVQIGSPSRTQIEAYKNLAQHLKDAVDKINLKFGNPSENYLPVILLAEHHEWEEIKNFYQLGDTCMVTSLHDGMNLVAKEYIWCQKPERGSLILSKFTGAAPELPEAFIVNPYSIEEMADALAAALRLSPLEKERRMTIMRNKVASGNAFNWACEMIKTVVSKPM